MTQHGAFPRQCYIDAKGQPWFYYILQKTPHLICNICEHLTSILQMSAGADLSRSRDEDIGVVGCVLLIVGPTWMIQLKL